MLSCMVRLRQVLALALVALGCGDDDGDGATDAAIDAEVDMFRDYTPEPFEPTDATRAYCPRDDVDAIEERITEILSTLSVREKVALMHGDRLALVDGVWLVEGNERVGLPGLGMLDGPRGLSSFTGKTATAFPVAILRGATWDTALEERVGAAMGRELRSGGADVILAPTINLLRHPRWGRTQETYSEDTHHLGSMGVAFIRGVQSEGVLASAKHYAVNSIEDTRHEVDVQIEERTLREVYLPHFRRAVQEAQVGSVMSAYNKVNGDWCDQSTHLLREILKDEWQFQGFVESDWILGTHGAATSVRAGLDIEMPNAAEFRRLPAQVADGELDEAFLDDAVRRIARAQLCYDLADRERGDDPSARETAEHLALAREVAARGMVLLKNEGRPPARAPLPLAAGGSYVVTGPLATVENIGDEGSSSVEPSDVVTALEGLMARGDVTHVTDVTADSSVVGAADAVIVVAGLAADDEGEASIGAGDRETLALPAEQLALIAEVVALNDSVVLVLEGSGPLLLGDTLDDVSALLWAGYPGSAGGDALADVLYGDVAPSGRLPFSWPLADADLPEFDNESLVVSYGYLHGYRHLQSEGTAPRFPFGFGLGYTTFAFEAIRTDAATLASGATLTIEVDVTNEGAVAGRATVQVYVSVEGSAVARAPNDLRAFAPIDLEAGATGTATMTIAADDLRYWDEDSGAWVLETTDYTLHAGANVETLPLSATVTVP